MYSFLILSILVNEDLQLSLLSFCQYHWLQTIHHSRSLYYLPFHFCCYLSVTNHPRHSSPPTPPSIHTLFLLSCELSVAMYGWPPDVFQPPPWTYFSLQPKQNHTNKDFYLKFTHSQSSGYIKDNSGFCILFTVTNPQTFWLVDDLPTTWATAALNRPHHTSHLCYAVLTSYITLTYFSAAPDFFL